MFMLNETHRKILIAAKKFMIAEYNSGCCDIHHIFICCAVSEFATNNEKKEICDEIREAIESALCGFATFGGYLRATMCRDFDAEILFAARICWVDRMLDLGYIA